MSIFDDLFNRFFAKQAPIPDKGYLDEIPKVYVYHDGKMISEAEYKLIKQEDIKLECTKKREDNIAAIKRRFENYEEILEVIEQLSDGDKDHALDFLVSLRKKQRDELNWEEYKNKLLLKRRD